MSYPTIPRAKREEWCGSGRSTTLKAVISTRLARGLDAWVKYRETSKGILVQRCLIEVLTDREWFEITAIAEDIEERRQAFLDQQKGKR